MTLVVCIDRQDNLSLWPLKQDKPGKCNDFNITALQASDDAKKDWIYLTTGNNCYGSKKPLSEGIPDPDWQAILANKSIKTLGDILRIAFPGDRVVATTEHPFMRELLYGAVA